MVKTNPILVISMPRSGSSWIGNTLSLAKNAIYFREPITQSYQTREDAIENITVFEEVISETRTVYQNYMDLLYNKVIPLRLFNTAKNTQVVIKEVNPLSLNWIVHSYKPKIIYLLRHPVAITNSFRKLGWQNITSDELCKKHFKSDLPDFSLFDDSYFAKLGAFQAVVLNKTMKILQNYGDYIIIKYEDFCIDPTEEFSKLFDLCKLEWDKRIMGEILQSTQSENAFSTGTYGLTRNSTDMIKKWKNEVSDEEIIRTKEAYYHYNPPLFYDESDWE